MYLNYPQTYYDAHGGQHARRGHFLLLVSSDDLPFGPDNFRAAVRKVALHQVGHFMIGYARLFGHTFVVSGTYGSDGLPMTVPHDVFLRCTPVPRALYDAWAYGGGHNSAGLEASDMRAFGRTLIP